MLENDALVIYSQGNYFGIDDRRNLKSLESINVAAEFQCDGICQCLTITYLKDVSIQC